MKEQPNGVKLPIFLACPEPSVIKIISDLLDKANYDKEGVETPFNEAFEIAVIQPDIARKLNDTYLLMKMDDSIRTQILENKKDDAENMKAKQAAFNIRSVVSQSVFGKDSKNKVNTFTAEQLSIAVQVVQKRKLSHKELNQLLDFVSLHNFIEPLDINEKRHLRIWKFTFSPQDHIEATQSLQRNVLSQIEALQGQYEQLEQNLQGFVEQIEDNAKNDPTGLEEEPDTSGEPTTTKKKVVRKKQAIQAVIKPSRSKPKG